VVVEPVLVDFPLRGEWKVLRPRRHGRFAFDFVAAGGPKRGYSSASLLRRVATRVPVAEFHGWSRPVFAPFDGTVVHASDGWPDRMAVNLVWDSITLVLFRPRIRDGDIRPSAGNFVMIQSGSSVAFLAHLRQGSIKVAAGGYVARGKLLGEVGNSGNSLVPHLHFQLMDGGDPTAARLLAFHVKEFESWNGSSWRQIQYGFLRKGMRIRR
jgi:hypothetical protein